jgi:ribulose-phosphate 3-epimerase
MAWKDWIRGVEIEPSLYAADFLRLGDQIQVLLAAGARIFHIDVGDGRFIPPVTIGPVVVRSIAPVVHEAGGWLDCHLMVGEPEAHFQQIREAGGDSVTFHLEVCSDVSKAVALARSFGLGVGLAFNPATAVEDAAQATLASGVDVVLCMSVHPGYSGQAFLPDALDRIHRLHEAVGGRALVQVDGGLRDGNIQAVREAGADLIVAGSAIFHTDDVAGAYARLVEAAA